MFYRCLETEQLFVDPMFPPCESSLYVSKSSPEIKWIRASELVEDPQFFVGGGTRFDINQGELGDCWLLAALANLTLNKRLLYQGKVGLYLEAPKNSVQLHCYLSRIETAATPAPSVVDTKN